MSDLSNLNLAEQFAVEQMRKVEGEARAYVGEDFVVVVRSPRYELLDMVINFAKIRVSRYSKKLRKQRGRRLNDQEMQELVSIIEGLRKQRIPYTRIGKALGVNAMTIRAWRKDERRPGTATLEKARTLDPEQVRSLR